MILQCSAGHRFDNLNPWHKGLNARDKCPEVLSYDRGVKPQTIVCNRTLSAPIQVSKKLKPFRK